MHNNYKSIVIFGGTGFIGTFFANYLLNNNICKNIYLIDKEEIGSKNSNYRKTSIINNRIKFYNVDICNLDLLLDLNIYEVDLIVNFAAVHREPGHLEYEYFETNLLGAENVCKFAEKINCNEIIFSSSISPYGVSKDIRSESNIPVPNTSYGSSKLVAEKIHQIWRANNLERILTIIRPGVVFGPGECGNVSRLIHSVINYYFVYVGNKNIRKAGIYVKELCSALWWIHSYNVKNYDKNELFNITMYPSPSIKEYVNTIKKVANIRSYSFSINYKFLFYVFTSLEFLTILMNINNFFSPVRLKKLVRSNEISSIKLIETGYIFKYDLLSAFEDWKRECPEEWGS